MGKYVIYKNKKGKYFFNLLTDKEITVLTSQNYMTRKGALKGSRSTIKNAKKAPIEDHTSKKQVHYENPKFVIDLDRNKKYSYKLIAANGKDVGKVTGLKSFQTAKKYIEEVKKNAKAKIEKKTVIL